MGAAEELAALEAEVAALEAKARGTGKAPAAKAPRKPRTRAAAKATTEGTVAAGKVNTPTEKQMLKYGHGGFQGKTLINRIEDLLDKQRKRVKEIQAKDQSTLTKEERKDVAIRGARAEGLGAAISILRSTDLAMELKRSDERLKPNESE